MQNIEEQKRDWVFQVQQLTSAIDATARLIVVDDAVAAEATKYLAKLHARLGEKLDEAVTLVPYTGK